MTDRHDAPPGPWDPRDLGLGHGVSHGVSHGVDEVDHTGVRAILSALPDPGPMPAELVERINATLAAELSRHESEVGGGVRNDGRPAHSGGTAHSLTLARERRAGRSRRLPALAVAASVVVLAGAVLMGLLTMNNSLGTMNGNDASLESAVSDAAPDEGDAGGAAEPFAGRVTDSAPADTGQAEDEETMSMAAAGPAILATGRALTTATLAEHARILRDDAPVLGHDPEAARSMVSSPVGTPEGAGECLGGLLAISSEEATALVTAVDFVRFAGSPAALILAVSHDQGTDLAGKREPDTAYLVPLDCGQGSAVPLHEPVRIDS